MLASPLFDTIIDATIYTNLYKLIGIDKLASCTELQFNNGQYFKKFIESLEKSSPAKLSAVLPIIKEACTANQEQDLPSRITEFLNTNKDLTPPNASNLLSALGTFSTRKRSNDDSEDAQAKIQKLKPPSPPRKP